MLFFLDNFNVTNKDGKIVKISLNKSNFKIGDKIVGFMDFSDTQVSCVEVKRFWNDFLRVQINFVKILHILKLV